MIVLAMSTETRTRASRPAIATVSISGVYSSVAGAEDGQERLARHARHARPAPERGRGVGVLSGLRVVVGEHPRPDRGVSGRRLDAAHERERQERHAREHHRSENLTVIVMRTDTGWPP